jgi:drug/metabolite transporter (DMT)-like permease
MPARQGVAVLAVLALLLNAATWGVSWWPFRLLLGQGLHPLWTTALIYAAALVAVSVWWPAAWGLLRRRPALWLIVVASGSTNAAFNWGVTVGDVTRVVLLFYLMPLWTVAWAWWLLGERPHGHVWARVALAVAGAAVVLGGDRSAAALFDGATWHLADVLGLAGGAAFALNNVMLRREAAQPEAGRALAMFLGGCVLPALLAAWMAWHGGTSALVAWPPVPAWGWVLPVAGLAAVFLASNLALQYGAARLPANVTSVVMPAEVVFASVSAIAWGGDQLSVPVLVGGLMILGATLLAAWEGAT